MKISNYFSDFLDHFTLTGTGNSRSLAVSSPLPTNILNENSQVFLIIIAERNLVTPTTATIVVNLPQGKIYLFSPSFKINRQTYNKI